MSRVLVAPAGANDLASHHDTQPLRLTHRLGFVAYTVDEVALRHGAGVEEETNDSEVEYERLPPSKPRE